MKTALLIISLLAGACFAYGQGTVTYYDRVRAHSPLVLGQGETNAIPSYPLFETGTGPVATNLPPGTGISFITGGSITNSGSGSALQIRTWDNSGGTISSWAQFSESFRQPQLSIIVPAEVRDLWATFPLFSSSWGSIPLGTYPDGPAWDPAATTVPEPSSIAIIGFGLAAMLYARRRR